MYFKLKNIEYQVHSASVSFEICPDSQELLMFIEVKAKTDSKEIDSELNEVYLYHNEGVSIGGKTLRKLPGKRFEWDDVVDKYGVEAGNLYILEHEDVTSGVIEVLDVTEDKIRIRWMGYANVFWNEEFGENVHFETEIEAPLPELPKFKVINGMKNTRAKIDKDTELVFLNFEDLLKESQRCLVLWRQDDREAWQKYNAVLKLKLIHKGVEYKGEAIYKDSAIKCKVVFDEICPVKIKIFKTALDTANEKYSFYISIDN